MKKIVATAAIAATLLSASVSEAAYQSESEQMPEQRHSFVVANESGSSTVDVSSNRADENTPDNSQNTPLPDGTTFSTYTVEANSGKEAAISIAEERQKMFAENGMLNEVVEIEATGYADAGNLEAAMEDMKRNAVENVLLQISNGNGRLDGKYQKLSDEYNKYVKGSSLISAKTEAGMLEIKAKVSVDKGMILSDVAITQSQSVPTAESSVEQAGDLLNQKQVPDVPVVSDDKVNVGVFLRVLGSRDSNSNEVIASTSYNEALQAKELNVAADMDAIQNGFGKYDALSYSEYCVLMRQRAVNLGPDVKIAVVGEIVTESVLVDDTGVTQKSSAHIEVYDLVNNRNLGNMTTDYFARGIDAPSAEAAAIQKAADESSRVIAQEIAKYLEIKKASTI